MGTIYSRHLVFARLVGPGRSGSHLFSGKFPNMAVLAMQMDFGI